jgi:hypothetical protein
MDTNINNMTRTDILIKGYEIGKINEPILAGIELARLASSFKEELIPLCNSCKHGSSMCLSSNFGAAPLTVNTYIGNSCIIVECDKYETKWQ